VTQKPDYDGCRPVSADNYNKLSNLSFFYTSSLFLKFNDAPYSGLATFYRQIEPLDGSQNEF